MLATEVASRNPTTPQDWEEIASILSRQFNTPEKHIKLKGWGCRERIKGLLEKYNQDDKRSLKK